MAALCNRLRIANDDVDSGNGLENLRARSAPRGDRPGLGTAVNLEHRRAAERFYALRGFRRQRGRRGEDALERRQRLARKRAGAQMRRRRNQPARRLRAREGRCDLGRQQRTGGIHRAAALQRQHHGGLQPPHVLRRDRAYDRRAADPRNARLQRARTAHKRSPGLGVRARRTGGPGGKQDDGNLAGRKRGRVDRVIRFLPLADFDSRAALFAAATAVA